MMNTIQHKIQTASFDINAGIKTVSMYAWIASAVCFVCYLYFVGAITFSVVERKSLVQETKQLVSSISVAEAQFLRTQKTLTETYAYSTGLVEASSVAYTTPKRAFAWNVGR